MCRLFTLSPVVLIVALLLSTQAVGTSFGIYHLSARQAAAPNCTVPRIPWNMCTACKLKPFTVNPGTNNVNFHGVNRFDIYNLSSPQCRKMIERYVAFNPCDTVRANALAKLDTDTGYRTMIYFMYSVCETCCDCIPIGSRESQYEERKKNGTLINIYRGNCAAHFYYDTCRIWPKARQITGLYGKRFNSSSNANFEWCPDFKKWQFSPDAKQWIKNNQVNGVTWRMRRAMRHISIYGRCGEETQWKNCVKMELAQKRV